MNRKTWLGGISLHFFLVACVDDNPTVPDTSLSSEPAIEIRLSGKDFDPSIMDSVPNIQDAPSLMMGSISPEQEPGSLSKTSTLDLNLQYKYYQWTQLPGHSAKDIAIGAYPYHIDDHYRLRRYRNNSWEYHSMPYSTVIRIDARYVDGVEHIVAIGGNGAVYHYRSDTDVWTYMSGTYSAVDVAISDNGVIWHIGSSYQIYYYNGSGWTQIPGSAYRISGGPIVRTLSNQVSRWYGSYWGTFDDTHTVNDVCGDIDWAPGNVFMHIGSGIVYTRESYQYTYSETRYWKGDPTTHNGVDVACNSTKVMHTNSNGEIYLANR